jgi:molecular chaperone GrpE
VTNEGWDASEESPDVDSAAAPPDDLEFAAEPEIESDVELQAEGADADEAQQYLEDLQRATAEFANYRRQAEKRNTEAAERAAISVVEVLLPALDACDQAADLGSSDVDPIRSLLMQSLQREGLERFGQTGETFDPQLHEAVMREAPDEDVEDDSREPIIAEVMRSGYSFGGVVVRAAMVTVKG